MIRSRIASALRRLADRIDPPREEPAPVTRTSYARWRRAMATGRADPIRAALYPALMAQGLTMARLSILSGVNENALSAALSWVALYGSATPDTHLNRVRIAADVLGAQDALLRALAVIDARLLRDHP